MSIFIDHYTGLLFKLSPLPLVHDTMPVFFKRASFVTLCLTVFLSSSLLFSFFFLLATQTTIPLLPRCPLSGKSGLLDYTEIPWRSSGPLNNVASQSTLTLTGSTVVPVSTSSSTSANVNCSTASELGQTLDPSLIVAEQESLNQLMINSGLIYQVNNLIPGLFCQFVRNVAQLEKSLATCSEALHFVVCIFSFLPSLRTRCFSGCFLSYFLSAPLMSPRAVDKGHILSQCDTLQRK